MPECWISVDIEFDGPIPGDYSMISLGAAVIGSSQRFYRILKPISAQYDQETFAVSGLQRQDLEENGSEPTQAMRDFANFAEQAAAGRPLVFVAYGLGKEWLFVDWYFWHFLGRNPFGHNGVDMNSYAMGAFGLQNWHDVSLKRLPVAELSLQPLSHNALEDAVIQGETFERLKRYCEGRG